MAKFSYDADQLMLDMQQIAEIPEDVIDEMLQAGSKVGVEAMRRTLRRMKLVDTGQLQTSLVAVKRRKDGRLYYLAYPKGRRKPKPHVLTVSNVNRVDPLHTYVKPPTNDEVGYVLEFGAPKRGIQPRQWMRTANEESADDVVAAEFKVYDDWLKSKGF